jgi:hypothetical protein
MDEIEQRQMTAQDIELEAKRFLPEEQAAYFKDVEAKHFDPEKAVGSLFTEVRNLQELLTLSIAQRGSLRGDDRNDFVALGANAAGLLPQCRYLKVNTEGEVGIVKVTDLSPETEVSVVRLKQGIPCTLIVEAKELPRTDFGTIIVGPNEQRTPESAIPSTSEMVWTVHPGLPVRPASADLPEWPEGSKITVQQVVDQLGADVYLNVKRRA